MSATIKNRIDVANPSDKNGAKSSFLLWFSSVPWVHHYVLAYGNIEEAIEAAAEFLLDKGLFGLITPHKEAYEEARQELGQDAADEEIWEYAERDQTYTESGYITSYEWGIALCSPSKQELIQFSRGK